MKNNANDNRLIQLFSSLESAGIRTRRLGLLYQLGHSTSRLTETLITLAERLYAYRQMEEVERVGSVLSLLPHTSMAGQYYRAIALWNSKKSGEEVIRLLDNVVKEAPLSYRGRAMLSLASLARLNGDKQSSLNLCCETAKLANRMGFREPHSALGSFRMMAVIRSDEGDHRGAVKLLEDIFPLASYAGKFHPHLYHDYLNSFAAELDAVGRSEEAFNACRIVIASPFAMAHTEWLETYRDLKLSGQGINPNRSIVAIHRSNLYRIGDYRHPQETSLQPSPQGAKRLLQFPERGDAMAHKNPQKEIETPDEKALLQKIDQVDYGDLRDKLIRAMKLLLQKHDKVDDVLKVLER